MPDKALTLQELVEQQYGVKTDVKISTIALTTTAQRICDNNPNRVGLLILNLGSTKSFINWSTGVSSTNGIQLVNNGGDFSLTWLEDFNIVGYEMYGVGSSGGETLFVAEIYTIGH